MIRNWAMLIGSALLAAGQSHAQTAPSPPAQSEEPGDQDQLKVTGQRMPTAEAPRSSTCEVLARDPFLRASGMANRAYLPTRLTRSPDYSAPPSVPPGSPLPDLAKSRFGMRDVAGGDVATSFGPSALDDTAADGGTAASLDQNSLVSAIAACRGAYARGVGDTSASGGNTGFIAANSGDSEKGAPMASPEWRVGAANARYLQARSFIASRDQTLPMGFALFDQGRYGEALDWFRKAANKLQMREGGDEAALFVGKITLQGLGDKSDPVEGVKWLKKVATAPFNPQNETPMFDPRQPDRNTAVGEAAVILANVYSAGFGAVGKDPAEARKWYDRAGDVGHIPAMKRLGDIYFEGVDTPRDVARAVGYYKRAAKLDHPGAQVALADILWEGEDGVPQDRKAALGWYQAAARNGHAGALYALARAYDLGEEVKADPELAMGFYKTAALGGNAAAKVAMGTYFYEGKLVPRDLAIARKWFEAGAAGDDADGMFNLAAMLAKGEGGGKDVSKALALLRRAALQGHKTAPAPSPRSRKRRTSRSPQLSCPLTPTR
ncbi:tetratricopeptide repeat protein [Sphingomonas sp. 7/4-4]|uniref:tetratricopeptide repeat protein n=1 Tax=Sphingomonas sp. 7/4-4 TaxID=3018446 RepID=UPI0022F3DC7A|nr:tetratricopeptide repeat protein [Sphingomonas sp. 7/4-4]WBY08294.1 tetratricopeptide repeat protein [Sphingomonas sp. 7/4-4]